MAKPLLPPGPVWIADECYFCERQYPHKNEPPPFVTNINTRKTPAMRVGLCPDCAKLDSLARWERLYQSIHTRYKVRYEFARNPNLFALPDAVLPAGLTPSLPAGSMSVA